MSLLQVYTCESLRLPDVADYWNSVLGVNEFQVSRFFRKITAHYCETLRGKRLALFGCAFKKGTPEVRYGNSRAVSMTPVSGCLKTGDFLTTNKLF